MNKKLDKDEIIGNAILLDDVSIENKIGDQGAVLDVNRGHKFYIITNHIEDGSDGISTFEAVKITSKVKPNGYGRIDICDIESPFRKELQVVCTTTFTIGIDMYDEVNISNFRDKPLDVSRDLVNKVQAEVARCKTDSWTFENKRSKTISKIVRPKYENEYKAMYIDKYIRANIKRDSVREKIKHKSFKGRYKDIEASFEEVTKSITKQTNDTTHDVQME